MVYSQTKNPNLGKFWRALDGENVDVFYSHLEYFTHIRDILWIFDTFCVHLVNTFFPVLVSCTKKNLATLLADRLWSERLLRPSRCNFLGQKKTGRTG
jgi:hypothetical protein